MAKVKVCILVMLVMLVMAFCAACEKDFATSSYSTLSALGHTYDGVMTAAGDAHKAGIINDETKEKIVDAGNVFYGSYHAAVNALEIYVKAKDSNSGVADAKNVVTQALSKAVFNMNEFIEQYNRIASGVNGMKTWSKVE